MEKNITKLLLSEVFREIIMVARCQWLAVWPPTSRVEGSIPVRSVCIPEVCVHALCLYGLSVLDRFPPDIMAFLNFHWV